MGPILEEEIYNCLLNIVARGMVLGVQVIDVNAVAMMAFKNIAKSLNNEHSLVHGSKIVVPPSVDMDQRVTLFKAEQEINQERS
jgi:hypothetical protein